MNTNAYYVRVTGFLPRKRKPSTLEARMSGPDLEEAKRLAQELVANHRLRNPKASYNCWGIQESDFTDSNGQKQTLVMRNIFPNGNSVEVVLS